MKSRPSRRAVLSLAAGAAFTMLAGIALPGTPAAAPTVALSGDDQAVLGQVNAYLNAMRSVRGRFTQIGPGGEFSEGAFYLARPGRIRFDYDKPNPILVVADGFWVGVQDRKLNTIEKYPLAATPLRLLLSEQVDLLNDALVTDFRAHEEEVLITLEDPRGTAPGRLTLIFGGPGLTLKQWVVIDAQGLRTEVTLFDLVTDASLSRRLFFIDDSSIYERGSRF